MNAWLEMLQAAIDWSAALIVFLAMMILTIATAVAVLTLFVRAVWITWKFLQRGSWNSFFANVEKAAFSRAARNERGNALPSHWRAIWRKLEFRRG